MNTLVHEAAHLEGHGHPYAYEVGDACAGSW